MRTFGPSTPRAGELAGQISMSISSACMIGRGREVPEILADQDAHAAEAGRVEGLRSARRRRSSAARRTGRRWADRPCGARGRSARPRRRRRRCRSGAAATPRRSRPPAAIGPAASSSRRISGAGGRKGQVGHHVADEVAGQRQFGKDDQVGLLPRGRLDLLEVQGQVALAGRPAPARSGPSPPAAARPAARVIVFSDQSAEGRFMVCSQCRDAEKAVTDRFQLATPMIAYAASTSFPERHSDGLHQDASRVAESTRCRTRGFFPPRRAGRSAALLRPWPPWRSNRPLGPARHGELRTQPRHGLCDVLGRSPTLIPITRTPLSPNGSAMSLQPSAGVDCRASRERARTDDRQLGRTDRPERLQLAGEVGSSASRHGRRR